MRRRPTPGPTPHTLLKRKGADARFHLGDCIETLRRFDARSVDVVITSPPYNLGVRYRSYDDRRPRADYLAWVDRWVVEVARILKPRGSFFLNVGSKPTAPWAALDVAQAVRPHLHLQNTLHWVKSIAIDRDAFGTRSDPGHSLAVGHYKPINSDRFVNDCHEFVFHFSPEGETPLDRLALGVAYQDESNAARWRTGGGGLRCRGNTWFLPYETIQSRDEDRPHPATFPVRLPEFCLRLHGLARIGRVVDPFLGLGATSVACARLGLPFDGIELDPSYLAEAVERTRQALA